MKKTNSISNIIKSISFVLLAVTVLAACKKSSPSGSGKLSLQFNAVNSGAVKTANTSDLKTFGAAVSTNTVPTGITWTSGYVYVSEIDFKATKDNATEIRYKSEGSRKVDLFNVNASAGDFTIPSGVYSKIKLELEIGTPQGAKYPGVYLSGTYGTTPIVFADDESGDQFEVEVEGRNFTFDSTKDYNSLINLHLNLLLNGVSNADLDAATKTNGTIVLNSTSNVAIYQKAKQNLQHLSDSDFKEKD
ncbi:MAG: hypothetical protein KKE39_04240 [Bacteroidetes bacterium]|nr:hypothetical protein [Bacteroidota bacterium]MBU1373054.1 hypothetical protein [Bacteroidota bacterium]MBU1484235.1 hypothetical protein [Bacteroidota bacterium]MBU1759352.1 hypothetical protein [Bacteroidota bacterium]MBU2046300.1 hypothetical protein [Bacteroidota bacterium]